MSVRAFILKAEAVSEEGRTASVSAAAVGSGRAFGTVGTLRFPVCPAPVEAELSGSSVGGGSGGINPGGGEGGSAGGTGSPGEGRIREAAAMPRVPDRAAVKKTGLKRAAERGTAAVPEMAAEAVPQPKTGRWKMVGTA